LISEKKNNNFFQLQKWNIVFVPYQYNIELTLAGHELATNFSLNILGERPPIKFHLPKISQIKLN